MFYVYIIYSESLDKYYVGCCGDLEKRLHDHQVGHSNYTKRGRPWLLKWSRTFQSRQQALTEERMIKAKKSRKYIEFLIGAAG